MDPMHFFKFLKKLNFKQIGKFSFLKDFFQFSQSWAGLKHQKIALDLLVGVTYEARG